MIARRIRSLVAMLENGLAVRAGLMRCLLMSFIRDAICFGEGPIQVAYCIRTMSLKQPIQTTHISKCKRDVRIDY